MYQILHKQKKLTVAIITIASLGFFLWLFLQSPTSGFIKGGKCVAEVEGICITLSEYRREILKYSHLLTNNEMDDLIKQQVVENLIVQNLLYKKSKEMGFVASDEEVIETIKSDPTFQENGVFSSYKYKEILSRNGWEPTEYEEYIRKVLSIRKLLTLLQNAVYMTDEEKRINQIVHDIQISGKLYIITPDSVHDNLQISEKELLEYYEKNKEKFKTESRKTFRLWIVEEDKEKASSIYRSIKSGKEVPGFTLYTLPDDAQKLDAELLKTMENLSEKDPITVTKIGNKYYVVQLKESLKASYKDFNQVKKDIEKELLSLKKAELLPSKAQELAESLKKGGHINARYIAFDFTPLPGILNFLKMNQKDMVKLVFSNEKVFGPYSMAQGYGILYVEAKKEVKSKNINIDNELMNLKANAVVNLYIEHLLKNAKIKVNKEML